EVENHLHPTMQRQVLPDLLNAFPDTRFIVSTHSPLVVGSVKDSTIYALVYNEGRQGQPSEFYSSQRNCHHSFRQTRRRCETLPRERSCD
ncbi:MAG: hypothetical protein DRI57_33635, partial [Deltaproteobacteria bacterium]